MNGFLGPLVHFDSIDVDTLNRCLVAWGHKMGPLHRPRYGRFGGAHALFHEGRPVAVVATEGMIAAETCGLTRDEAFELARVCAERPGLCRAAVRLWREFAFPCFVRASDRPWAISYQDAVQHDGGLYRFDGWVRLGETSSGTDDRGREGVRRGRRKVVWGWSDDATLMAAAREADMTRERERREGRGWTDVRDTELRERWARRETATTIAAALGDVTRNQVIARAHGLNLP